MVHTLVYSGDAVVAYWWGSAGAVQVVVQWRLSAGAVMVQQWYSDGTVTAQ